MSRGVWLVEELQRGRCDCSSISDKEKKGWGWTSRVVYFKLLNCIPEFKKCVLYWNPDYMFVCVYMWEISKKNLFHLISSDMFNSLVWKMLMLKHKLVCCSTNGSWTAVWKTLEWRRARGWILEGFVGLFKVSQFHFQNNDNLLTNSEQKNVWHE